jgi:hypothetical protein
MNLHIRLYVIYSQFPLLAEKIRQIRSSCCICLLDFYSRSILIKFGMDIVPREATLTRTFHCSTLSNDYIGGRTNLWGRSESSIIWYRVISGKFNLPADLNEEFLQKRNITIIIIITTTTTLTAVTVCGILTVASSKRILPRVGIDPDYMSTSPAR